MKGNFTLQLLTENELGIMQNRIELVLDEMPHLLRLEIIRVIIAAAKHEATEQDSALDFLAKALRAGLDIHVFELLGIHAIAIADSVKSREICARLGCAEDIIRGDMIRRLEHRFFNDSVPHFLQQRNRLLVALLNLAARVFEQVGQNRNRVPTSDGP